MRSRAILKVSVTSLLASLLKPIWLSLICRKLRSVAAGNEDPAFAIWARVFDAKTPPLTVQSKPVPAQAMHCRKPRRSEEHTSELQSRPQLVCRLLLEKKKNKPW